MAAKDEGRGAGSGGYDSRQTACAAVVAKSCGSSVGAPEYVTRCLQTRMRVRTAIDSFNLDRRLCWFRLEVRGKTCTVDNVCRDLSTKLYFQCAKISFMAIYTLQGDRRLICIDCPYSREICILDHVEGCHSLQRPSFTTSAIWRFIDVDCPVLS